MEIADWRKRIDELDIELVIMLNHRAAAAQAIGRLKQQLGLPIYEPKREDEIFENIRRNNPGPLPDRDLLQLYERIIDVMRKLQRDDLGKHDRAPVSGGTELEVEADE
jgi:chorismate mutase